jgi:nanoRNase/pAp phosphatase (c-di-AMP/oligoRNAs hydrolase)
MTQNGGEVGKRAFLLSHNEKPYKRTERKAYIQKKDEDLIFMQIDADCDVIGSSYCKIIYIISKYNR